MAKLAVNQLLLQKLPVGTPVLNILNCFIRSFRRANESIIPNRKYSENRSKTLPRHTSNVTSYISFIKICRFVDRI